MLCLLPTLSNLIPIGRNIPIAINWPLLLLGSLCPLVIIGLIQHILRLNKSLVNKDKHIADLKDTVDRRSIEINQLIHIDSVTQFYKRSKLLPKIDEIIERGLPLILYVVNIKNLKSIDDNYGYRIGDIARNNVSGILKNVFISDDILFGRYYDNYYIVDYTSDALGRSDEIVTRLKIYFQKTIIIENHELPLQASVGVIGYSEGLTSSELMNRGDIAVLEIVNKPDKFFMKYNQGFHDYIKEQNDLKTALNFALENNELELHFQPQIDIETGKLYSSEALLRWFRADGTSVSPGIFIPIAESTGQIGEIGKWVIDECCRTLQQWEAIGITNSIAMNISPKQINPKLITILEDALRKYRIDPSKLYLEITETDLWEDSQEVMAILDRVRVLGIGLALDDFGVGYSSLEHMKNLKVDKLKIDKSFVDTIEQLETTAIIKSIIELGKTLDYTLIAEGVETEEQLDALSKMDVNRIQGWYFSKALPYDDYVAYYRKINEM